MGFLDFLGTSKTTQDQTSSPWAPAQPALQGMLSQVQTGLNNTGITSAENQTLGTLQNNGSYYTNTYANPIGAYATNLLNGGGAMDQAGNINQNYQNYYNQTNPLASNLNYDPNQNPGMAALLAQIQGDVGNSINGQFAAAGRDFSGANQQAYGRGIAQGEAPVLFNQYNANREAQQGAAGNLFNAGNTRSGMLTGLNQQDLANRAQGITASQSHLEAQNAGANATLQAEAARRGIPVQALGLLAQIGIPIGGLGGQTHSEGTQTASPAQVFGQIAGGFGALMPRAPIKFG